MYIGVSGRPGLHEALSGGAGGSKKDFLDIYALVQEQIPPAEMLKLYKGKFSVQDIAHVLYALGYFDDADKERTPKVLRNVDWRGVKDSTRKWVKDVA